MKNGNPVRILAMIEVNSVSLKSGLTKKQNTAAQPSIWRFEA
jgi:hypothetical protein